MFRGGVELRALLCCLIVSCLLGDTYAVSAPAHEEARAAVDQLHQWLETSPDAQRWRAVLRSDDLLAQLSKADQADPNVVAGVLARYAGNDPGLEAAPFHRVRRALEAWLGQLP